MCWRDVFPLVLTALPLQDEERMKKAVNKVPTAAELNRMLARNDKEVEIFDKMDAQPDWPTIPSGQSRPTCGAEQKVLAASSLSLPALLYS